MSHETEKKGNKETPAEQAGQETAQLEKKAAEHADQILRMKADFDNTRKRLERDKQEAIKYANEKLLAEVLPVMDNLDRAVASISEGHDPEKVKQGLRIAQEEMHKILELHGVEVIKAVGAEFDPRFHEAVATVEAGGKEGTVVEEVQRGYLLNGRLIRPSRVKIAQ